MVGPSVPAGLLSPLFSPYELTVIFISVNVVGKKDQPPIIFIHDPSGGTCSSKKLIFRAFSCLLIVIVDIVGLDAVALPKIQLPVRRPTQGRRQKVGLIVIVVGGEPIGHIKLVKVAEASLHPEVEV